MGRWHFLQNSALKKKAPGFGGAVRLIAVRPQPGHFHS
jgi:hypothetical protein